MIVVEKNISKRWEQGTAHHKKSEELYKEIANLDSECGGDFFCFKSGGDGDNGEHLMYILDIYFEIEETSASKRSVKNKTGFRGVSFYSPLNKYRAQVYHRCRQYHIGYYCTSGEANEAYLRAKARTKTHPDNILGKQELC